MKTVDFNGHAIRVAPDGKINITDVARALGLTRNQWVMENAKHKDLYEGELGRYRFDPRGPGATTISLSGVVKYLNRRETTTPDAVRLKRQILSFFRNEFSVPECASLLGEVQQFLRRLPQVPVDLAEEYVRVMRKLNAAN